jgi:hypothetical protein
MTIFIEKGELPSCDEGELILLSSDGVGVPDSVPLVPLARVSRR